MVRSPLSSLILLALLALASPAAHAQERKILSPRDSVVLTMDAQTIAVTYSRPSMRGRKVMGDLVPWDRVWRTGANQATHLRTTFDMLLGTMPVPRGTYTLWTIPSPDGWTVILNKQTGQWGTQYDDKQDLARFRVRPERLTATVDTFTIGLAAGRGVSGWLSLSWERTRITIPFEKRSPLPLLSPADSTVVRLGEHRLAIRYSRPFTRGRVIWGTVVPWDTVWRTGANMATTLETTADVRIGPAAVPRGTYTLFSLPTATSFTLIINRGRPADPPAYDRGLDVARIPMTPERQPRPVDPLRIWFERNGREAAVLRLGWADRTFAVPVTIR